MFPIITYKLHIFCKSNYLVEWAENINFIIHFILSAQTQTLALAMCDGIIDNFLKLSINFEIIDNFWKLSIIYKNLSIISGNYQKSFKNYRSMSKNYR